MLPRKGEQSTWRARVLQCCCCTLCLGAKGYNLASPQPASLEGPSGFTNSLLCWVRGAMVARGLEGPYTG